MANKSEEQSTNNNICSICEKPISGVSIEGANVYHFECAFGELSDTRKRAHGRNYNPEIHEDAKRWQLPNISWMKDE